MVHSNALETQFIYNKTKMTANVMPVWATYSCYVVQLSTTCMYTKQSNIDQFRWMYECVYVHIFTSNDYSIASNSSNCWLRGIFIFALILNSTLNYIIVVHPEWLSFVVVIVCVRSLCHFFLNMDFNSSRVFFLSYSFICNEPVATFKLK